MRTFHASALALMLLGATIVHAQDALRPRWDIHGGLALNRHAADFRALPGVPNCCPLFESGSGVGPLFGVAYEFPLGGSLLLSLGAGYADHSALLSAREPVLILAGSEVQSGAFEHTIDATFSSVGIEPTLGVRLFDGFFASGGIRVAAILSPKYAQKEVILEPSNTGTFLDSLGKDSGSRTRNQNAGDIPDAAPVLVQGIAGIAYELPLNSARTLLLVPGVSYALSFTNVVNGYAWKPNALRFTLGLKYSPLPAKEVRRDTVYLRDTAVLAVARGNTESLRLDRETAASERIEGPAFDVEHVTISRHYVRETPKPNALVATLTAFGVEDGHEQPAATLRIEEFLRTNAHPVLGYVFFGEGSSDIPARYARMASADADRFEPRTLFGENAMGISHNVLNIIGYNLRRHADAGLTITGCNANTGAEAGNRTLSRARAEAVKRYLVDVWGIAAGRLTVVDRDLPAIPSNSRTPDGNEENRRVEITSNVPEVTDVFVAEDTTRTANPPVLRFKSVVRAAEAVAGWKLSIRQHGDVLKEFSGTGAPPKSVDWEIAGEERSLPRFSEPLSAELEVTAGDGERAVSTATLTTEVITVQRKQAQHARDYRIDQYNLVLFDVGKATITEAHQRTIALVRSRLTAGASVTVEGYSDRTGDAEANRRLARGRAQSTATALGRTDATVVGVGEDRLLYDNDTPEGRFYCRTVRITVKTPTR